MSEHGLMTTLMRPFFKKGADSSFCVPDAVKDGSRILCIDPGDLTEVLFHIPLVSAIRRRYPGSKIDFLLPENHAPLIVPSGLARQCILYKENQLRAWRPAFGSLLRQLGAGNYDMAVVMSFQPRAQLELAALASGAALRLGPSHANSWPGVNFEMRPPSGGSGYLGDRLAGIGPFFGFLPGELRSGWPLPMDKVRQMAQQVHFHKPNPEQLLVGIDPGVGKCGQAIAPENLHAIARHLINHLQCRVLPLGNPDQRERMERFEQRLSDVPIGLGRDTLLEMTLLVAQCDLFVSGNTDFFHLAASLGIPCIGLFSPADDEQWIPTGRDHVQVVVTKKGAAMDFAALMDRIRMVTKGRASVAAPVVVATDSEDADADQPTADDPEVRLGESDAPGHD